MSNLNSLNFQEKATKTEIDDYYRVSARNGFAYKTSRYAFIEMRNMLYYIFFIQNKDTQSQN